MKIRDEIATTVSAIFWVIVAGTLFLAIAGCSTPGKLEPRVVVERMNVPVREACVGKDVPEAPKSYPDADLAKAKDGAERYQMVAAANEMRKGRLGVVEPYIAGCR